MIFIQLELTSIIVKCLNVCHRIQFDIADIKREIPILWLLVFVSDTLIKQPTRKCRQSSVKIAKHSTLRILVSPTNKHVVASICGYDNGCRGGMVIVHFISISKRCGFYLSVIDQLRSNIMVIVCVYCERKDVDACHRNVKYAVVVVITISNIYDLKQCISLLRRIMQSCFSQIIDF